LGENVGLNESKTTEVCIGIFEKIATSHLFEISAVKVSEVIFKEAYFD
jgi:hypothetical protein